MKPAKRQPLSGFAVQVPGGLAGPGCRLAYGNQNHGPIGKPFGLR